MVSTRVLLLLKLAERIRVRDQDHADKAGKDANSFDPQECFFVDNVAHYGSPEGLGVLEYSEKR